MTKPLQDQIIMVTGASSGIGAATITTLLNAGARVVALARRIERLEQMQTSLEAGSDRLLPLCFTLTRPGRVSLNEIVVRPTRQPI
ncbi:SDR family NAD(P)-dependent oxidoreductase [Halopseudomonas sp. Lyrl_26]|uniref:SDR family NAD(P)-dependent oxidoreductase n=1 Tax=Halopseudomonas sp. Lyrl_26 TaxID=3110923 RepID=UPI003F7E8EF5